MGQPVRAQQPLGSRGSRAFSNEAVPAAHDAVARDEPLANREHLAGKAAELLRGAGATEVYRIDWPPLILHVQSTMRMGLDERDSVVDERGESRWVKRLFIADNSALANGLGGPNPTLTTQAVATRTAEQIFATYFGGDPWVATEAPMSSIDDAVTAAVVARGL